jgi:hypothetical protein
MQNADSGSDGLRVVRRWSSCDAAIARLRWFELQCVASLCLHCETAIAPPQILLEWLLSHPLLSLHITGTRSASHWLTLRDCVDERPSSMADSSEGSDRESVRSELKEVEMKTTGPTAEEEEAAVEAEHPLYDDAISEEDIRPEDAISKFKQIIDERQSPHAAAAQQHAKGISLPLS